MKKNLKYWIKYTNLLWKALNIALNTLTILKYENDNIMGSIADKAIKEITSVVDTAQNLDETVQTGGDIGFPRR